jgi:sugar/nucleoside kinase (ribokinase family)
MPPPIYNYLKYKVIMQANYCGAAMSIVVVGSIAFDTIKTPFGQRENSLGGSANYFSIAAQFFTSVQVIGVIGEDFPLSHLDYLHSHNVDISGIKILPGNSFHWHGEYGTDLNEAKTIITELNVFEHFMPNLPDHFCNSGIVFLANIDPDLQIHVLEQLRSPKIKALDTMNFWIERKNRELKKAISMVDILFVNETELRFLTGEHNIIKAARAANKMGVQVVVIKRGEYGALLCIDNEMAFVPAYPTDNVMDPTGAGDTFAGGFLGYLDWRQQMDFNCLKQAQLMGAVMSSFVIEQFSFDRLLELDREAIMLREQKLRAITHIPEGAHRFLADQGISVSQASL